MLKKNEREKLKETESQTPEKDNECAPVAEKQEPPKIVIEETPKEPDDYGDKENQENQKFSMVTDEDREADKDALEKITSMIEERLKTLPLPLPPPTLVQASVDTSVKSNSKVPSKSKDGDSNMDIFRSADDDTTSETKASTEHDKPEASSPGRSKRHDRISRERHMERERESGSMIQNSTRSGSWRCMNVKESGRELGGRRKWT